MGERIDSFELEPTAENNSSQILDEETFSFLSQTVEGLISIEPDETLVNFALERDDIDEILYIFKFVSNPEIFHEIAMNSKKKEVIDLSKLFYNVLTSPPSIYQISSVNPGEKGLYIAYIYRDHSTREGQLHMAWKENFKKDHLFENLISYNRTSNSEYPNGMRSFGAFDVSAESENFIKIRFYGDASYKKGSEVPGYAPGILRNFKEELKEVFQNKFMDKDIEIEF